MTKAVKRSLMELVGMLVLLITFVLLLAGCGGSQESSSSVKETDYIEIEGLYVDDSYVSEENDKLKTLYVFYKVKSPDKNLSVSSNGLKLEVNEDNSYTPEMIARGGANFSNYYFDNVIEDVYSGDEMKMMTIFEVPDGDLESGKTITLSSSSIPSIEELKLSTDDIQHCSSVEEMAKQVDPEGYEAEMKKLESASDEVTKQVKNAMNGGSWSVFANGTSYNVSFSAPNKFSITSMGFTNTGTYSVTNGYVIMTYPDTGLSVYVPWSWDEQPIDLELDTGLSEGGVK